MPKTILPSFQQAVTTISPVPYIRATVSAVSASLLLPQYCFTALSLRRQYCFQLSFFGFSVTTITREPLHLAWGSFVRIYTSTTSRTVLNFKVIGQRSRLHAFFVRVLCAWHWCHPQTVLSLEQGLALLVCTLWQSKWRRQWWSLWTLSYKINTQSMNIFNERKS